MRRALSVLVLLAGADIANPALAQNYPWCAQYSGDMGGAMNCGFVSFDQCMATARGIGGFCVINNVYRPPSPAKSPRATNRHVTHKS